MIQFTDVHKSFGPHKVLNGLNLTIPDGKITVILGPSGGGKSVLLRHMMGLTQPDRGKVSVDGVDLSSMNERQLNDFRKRFGMLFQSAALFDSLNVEENVAFPLREHLKLSDAEIHKKVKEKLALVGLTEAISKLPSELSGGMRKRVGLARAIALNPAIILYDEPTTGLDPLMTASINHLIAHMQKSLKITSVVISHDIESTFAIADQVAVLFEGKIIACGTPADIQKSEHPFIRKFIERRVN